MWKSCTLLGLALVAVALPGRPVSAQVIPWFENAPPNGTTPLNDEKLRITTSAASPQRVWVTPSEPVDEPQVPLQDVPSKSLIELYPVGATTDGRAQKGCKLKVNDKQLALSTKHADVGSEATCAALLAGFFAGDTKELAISNVDETPYAVLALKVPTYQGQASNVVVDEAGQVTLPKEIHINVNDNDKVKNCLLFLGTWQKATCTTGSVIEFSDVTTPEALKAALARGDKLWLYINNVVDADSAQGAWRRIPVGLRDDRKTVRNDLVERCNGAVQAKHRAAKHSAEDKADVELLSHTYFVCVDAYPDQRNVEVLSCESPTKCTQVGETVDVNHSFVVNVWTRSEFDVSITLGGTPGPSPGIYDSTVTSATKNTPSTKLAMKEEEQDQPTVSKTFGARKPGPANLVVSVVKRKDGALDTAEVAHVAYPFNVLDLYHVVVRLGLALAWQPWARSVGILATPDGQRYAAVTEGEANGLYRTEVSAGFTYFPCPIHQDTLDVQLGIGLRLGVLSIGSDTKILSSAMVGPELAIGTDLSIGLFAGVARHDAANTGFEPGKLVAPAINSIPTHMTATGEFAIVLNFTPGISKAIGVSK